MLFCALTKNQGHGTLVLVIGNGLSVGPLSDQTLITYTCEWDADFIELQLIELPFIKRDLPNAVNVKCLKCRKMFSMEKRICDYLKLRNLLYFLWRKES